MGWRSGLLWPWPLLALTFHNKAKWTGGECNKTVAYIGITQKIHLWIKVDDFFQYPYFPLLFNALRLVVEKHPKQSKGLICWEGKQFLQRQLLLLMNSLQG